MIPLYKSSTSTPLKPVKNPIYLFRKAVGKEPTTMASVIVLNSENSVEDTPDLDGGLLPASFSFRPDVNPTGTWYDVEVSSDTPMWDEQVEPNADRDGSLAGEPHALHRILTLRGFVRASNLPNLMLGINHLNYSFDPVINFLEQASTFDHSLTPNSQPFNNVGFGVLAWFSADAGFGASDTDYGLINRFMFVRSEAHPVQLGSKFDDFSAAFNIQLLAIDPRVYEFIAPTSFGQTVTTVNGNSLTPEGSGAPTITSTETVVKPSRIWAGTDMTSPWGPGYREETGTLS